MMYELFSQVINNVDVRIICTPFSFKVITVPKTAGPVNPLVHDIPYYEEGSGLDTNKAVCEVAYYILKKTKYRLSESVLEKLELSIKGIYTPDSMMKFRKPHTLTPYELASMEIDVRIAFQNGKNEKAVKDLMWIDRYYRKNNVKPFFRKREVI